MINNTPISLFELLNKTKQAINHNLEPRYWVKVLLVSIDSTGSWDKLTLCNQKIDDSPSPKANCRAKVWGKNRITLRNFKSITGMDLVEDTNILIQCSVEFHPEFGFMLDVFEIDPSYTLGIMQESKDLIKRRLKELKIFSNNRNQIHPKEFCNVAVISPENSAGLSDFQVKAKLIEERNICRFKYFNSLFQGPNTEKGLLNAFTKVHKEHSINPFDALVLIRGGGEKSKINELNTELIAKLICRSRMPVLTGIGHESDSTLLDELSNKAFSTPTDVISHIFRVIQINCSNSQKTFDLLRSSSFQLTNSIKDNISNKQSNLMLTANSLLANSKNALSVLKTTIEKSPSTKIQYCLRMTEKNYRTLTSITTRLCNETKANINNMHRQLMSTSFDITDKAQSINNDAFKVLSTSPFKIILNAKKQNENMSLRIKESARSLIQKSSNISRNLKTQIDRSANNRIQGISHNCEKLKISLINSTTIEVQNIKVDLANQLSNVTSLCTTKISQNKQNLFSFIKSVNQQSFMHCEIQKKHLTGNLEKLIHNSKSQIKTSAQEIKHIWQEIKFQDPKNILANGYAYIQNNENQIIRNTSNLFENQLIKINFIDGSVKAKVEKNNE